VLGVSLVVLVGAVVMVGVVAVEVVEVVGAEVNPSPRNKISRKVYRLLWKSYY
jgi:hypothetical protein